MKASQLPWYKVVADSWGIQDEFANAWILSGGPKDAAMFGIMALKRGPLEFYFSPGAFRIAGEIIAQHGGKECPQPRPPLALLVGDQRALALIEENN